VLGIEPLAADPCCLWHSTTAFEDNFSCWPCDNSSICPIPPGKKLKSQKAEMASTEEQPVDDRDALDILDAEGKEWEKASYPPRSSSAA
jgi:hypothetical protein